MPADRAERRAAPVHRGVRGRALDGPGGPRATLRDEAGIALHGLNFATHDPLSLTLHTGVREAAAEALARWGPHALGYPSLAGGSTASAALEAAISDLVGLEHVVLFPSGWAAAFGALTVLVRADDHVLLDAGAHPALLAGARAATPRIHCLPRTDPAATLRAIRRRAPHAAILVVAEALLPFEARRPDLGALAAACGVYDAALLTAVGPDLGVLGPGGRGMLAAHRLHGRVEVVIGSLAKSFAANGGFLATRHADLERAVRVAASPHAASNGISPLQAAVATEAIRIARSAEGDRLRADLARACDALREAAVLRGLTCLGDGGPIVPIAVGSETEARLTERHTARRGVLTALVEAPLVPRGAARLALHVTAAHRPAHGREAAAAIAAARTEAAIVARGAPRRSRR